MGISSTGIGSGLDVNTIVSSLMASESVPLDRLKAKETSFNAKLSAFGTIKSAISTFQTALKGMASGALSAQTSTSSDTSILTVSTDTTAVSGNYAIEVTQLAQSHKRISAGSADTTTAFASGTMSIQIGSKPAVTIPAAAYSLAGLAKAINSANAGVSATIINDGTVNRLSISSNDSGTANQMTITAGGGLAEFDSASGTMTQQQQALDAKLKIDNVVVTKSSNTVTDAISGVTLNLVKANVGSTVNVTIARDKTAMKTAITGFVDAYNTLTTAVSKLTAYDSVAKTGAVLNGDAGVNNIVVSLRKQLGTVVAGAGGLDTLSDIGVSFQRDGKLLADDTKLTKALTGNLNDVANLFTSTDGFVSRLTKLSTDMLSSKGLVQTRTDGLKSTIKGITDDEAEMTTRLANVEKRYRAQFSALDTTISSMKSTSSYLTQELAAIAANN